MKLPATGVAFALIAGPAFAADLPAKAPAYVPPAPIFSWTGFYAGIHGGHGWGDADYLAGPVQNLFGGFYFPLTGGSFGQDIDGHVFGGQLGFNYQVGNWVVGLEGAFAHSGLSGTSRNVFSGSVAGNVTIETDLGWLASITPRLGLAVNNGLFYVKGGLAAGEVETDLHNSALPSNFREKERHIGWTVGVGAEYAWTPNWVLGVEYNYYNLGSQQYGGLQPLGGSIQEGGEYETDVKFHTVLARLSYKPGVPVAAVLPTKAPVYETPVGVWSGLYAGVHGGYGWGKADYSFAPQPFNPFSPEDGGTFDQDFSGGVFGGQLGYNQQYGNWVVGLEGSLAWSNMDDSSRDEFVPQIATGASYDTELRWLATLTPRLGYAWNHALLYVKGGVAAGEAESRLVFTPTPGTVFEEKNDHVGWTVGAGLEWAWTPNWILGVEYNYYNLGSQPYGGMIAVGPENPDYDVDLKFHTVLARLSYKFGDLAPVVTRY